MEPLKEKKPELKPKKIILKCDKCGSTYLMNFPDDFMRNKEDIIPSSIANETCHCGEYLHYFWEDDLFSFIPRLRYLWWKMKGKVE